MSSLAKIELPNSWDAPVDVAAVVRDVQSTQVAVLPRGVATAQTMRLDEPSTLTLALIGVGVLVAFRGVQKRVGVKVRKAVVPRTERPLVKPRRRAA